MQITPPTSHKISILRDTKHTFVAELAKWENALKPIWIQQARKDILASHDGKPPKVLDPFGGRGSYPLEAQRLGCETHSCDLNPVAVLIQKCTLEYPQRYGQRLHDDVKKWGEQILAEVAAELQPFYPKEPDGSDLWAFIWARTLPCQNINCGVEIPLLKQFWLAKNRKKKISLFPEVENGQIAFRLVGTGHDPMPDGFDSANGTVDRAIATCPRCGSTIPAKDTHRLFQNGEAGEKLLAVVTRHPEDSRKRYRLVTDADLEVFKAAKSRLSEKQRILETQWGMSPVPDEPTPIFRVPGFGIFRYNLKTYGKLFNPRQQLALITFAEKIRDTYPEILGENSGDTAYARAVATYLGFWLDRIAQNGSNLCRWLNNREMVIRLFGMQTLPMIWDYPEADLICVATNCLKTLLKPMEHLCAMDVAPATVKQASATDLPYADNTFDAVLTDPPYYDNIAYAYLSDFFYVWLKRSIGWLYPDMFAEAMTPKDAEIVAYAHRKGGKAAGKKFFEKRLAKSFREIHRVLKPEGITTIVYAHKSTEGWETMMNALLDSGLVITGAWPIDTQLKSKMIALNAAALASAIYMVARKRERQGFGIYQDVKQDLEIYLSEKLFTLWECGGSGANLFIAAIGLGLEVFGKYEKVIDAEDNVVRSDTIIENIREILERFDGEQAGLGATQLTRFYLRWRREYRAGLVVFNDAHKLAMSLGIELTEAWGDGSFIQKEKVNVRVLGPHERELSDVSKSEELIDVLHAALLLWVSGDRAEMIEHLSKDGVGGRELIWSIADQIREALPIDNQERQLLDGWLADRESIQRDVAAHIEGSQ